MDTTAAKSLVKAQSEMGAVIKNAQNPHLKNKYADLGAVLDACSEALHRNGFAILQPAGTDDHGPYVETIFLHESGATFASRVHLLIGKNDMQGLGSAQTYARRYGLLGMTGLAPEDDDGHAAVQNRQKAAPKPEASPAPAFDASAVKAWLLKQISNAAEAKALDAVQAQPKWREGLDKLAAAAPGQAKEVVAEAARKRFSFGSGEPVILGEHRLEGVM